MIQVAKTKLPVGADVLGWKPKFTIQQVEEALSLYAGKSSSNYIHVYMYTVYMYIGETLQSSFSPGPCSDSKIKVYNIPKMQEKQLAKVAYIYTRHHGQIRSAP